MKIFLVFSLSGLLLGGFLFGLVSCNQYSGKHENGRNGGDWLSKGSVDERFEKVSKHLRGFDMVMVEVGYRFTELYWAGQDQNWDYAKYQVEKLRVAIENGTERRPKRSASAQMIFPAIDNLELAISKRSNQNFRQGFNQLCATCNACHTAEQVPFFKVAIPDRRLTPIRQNGEAAE